MTMNQGFCAQSSDVALNKGQWSGSGLGAATATTMVPGPGSTSAGSTAAPALGGPGILVPSGVLQASISEFGGGVPVVPQTVLNPTTPTGQILPSVAQTISKIAASFLGSSNEADVSLTVTFTLFCQRNNAAGVPQAPVSTGITTGPVSAKQVAGPTPTQAFADFSGLNASGVQQSWQVQAGDVYFVEATFSAALTGTITNVMAAIG